MIPPSTALSPADPNLPTTIAGIPNSQGIYLLTPEQGNPYLGWSFYLSKRLTRLLFNYREQGNSLAIALNDPHRTGRGALGAAPFAIRDRLIRVEYWLTGSRLETSLLLYWLGRRYYPDTYRKRLKLKDPWFLTLLMNDEFPRLAVRNRIPGRRVPTFGPFRSREAAEELEQGMLDLFQIRRCDQKLAPSEDHPGCIYGEMNCCLRPCQLAVSRDEYGVEVRRLSEFLQANGKHMLSVLTSARDRASEETDFEQAARLHKELERVKAVSASRDDLITEIDDLSGLALTRGYGTAKVALWPLLSGYWQPPLDLDFSAAAPQPRSLDQNLREQLATALAHPRREGIRLEEIGILSRWYYSSWRDGQWFAFHTLADLNYRKLVREISAILRGDL